MTSVNPYAPGDDLHAALLMGLLFRQIAEAFEDERWAGLRQSHFRVVGSVPPEGISITDLGDRVGMTKQGCGQFVTSLVESGHLRVDPDPADGRVRLVRRTARGEATNAAVAQRYREVEAAWASRVGERRYRTFRRVLEEIALS